MISVPMTERYAPSRPYRLGTQRRRPRQAAAAPKLGATRPRNARPCSVHTENQLATSVAKWMQQQETQEDKYKFRVSLWRRLCASVYSIWQDAARDARENPDGAEAAWWEAYESERAALKSDTCLAYDAWLEAYVAKKGLPACAETYLHKLYLDEWLKKHKPVGKWARAVKWEKQYFQLYHCQGEWIGYKASCCEERTQAVAVPIGCNHRLCPLCNWQRSQNAQLRIRKLFDRLDHPQFLTLTVGSTKKISKRTFEHIRKRVRQFIAQHKEMFHGGVYAIETTYNRREKTWHPHVHVLIDASYQLPSSDQFTVVNGRRILAFTFIKRALEYDWTRLWVKGLGKESRKNSSQSKLDGERFDFERWLGGTFDNALREFVGGRLVPIRGLSASEEMHRREWNLRNRRVLDIRPVNDRQKAVKEVLKYITKSSDFVDLPECIEAFCDATRGARMIQTFGSWYGIDFSTDFDTKHPEDWSRLECSCGSNHWERVGVLSRKDVEMDSAGRWHPRRALKQFSWDVVTVPRSTIPALQAPEQRTGDA